MAESIVRAVNAGIDLSFTIATSNWSSTSPYTYTWTSDKINAKSRITVEYYGTPATEASVGYIEYEKVTVTGGYGVRFTSPVLPTVGISVIVHILSSQAIRLESITGDMVQTSSISGAANVNEALTALNSKITPVSGTVTGGTGVNVVTQNCRKIGSIVVFTVYAILTADISRDGTIINLPWRASGRYDFGAMFYHPSDKIGTTYLPNGTSELKKNDRSFTNGDRFIIQGSYVTVD